MSCAATDWSALVRDHPTTHGYAADRGEAMKALAKTATYRVMNGFYGFAVAYAVTGKLAIAASVVGAEALYKTFAYFGHEKAWAWFTGENAATETAMGAA